MRDKETGKRWVPIVPDEARTFGMDSLFPTAKIYNPDGQNYLSVDRDLLLAYRESTSGQIKHMGINEISSTDRKSTRLNSSHVAISYAVFCLKKKKTTH